MAELFHGKMSHVDIPALGDDAVWDTPAMRAVVAEHGDLRSDLDQAARHELLTRRALTCRFGLDLALGVADRIA